jgi:hypothetical protein
MLHGNRDLHAIHGCYRCVVTSLALLHVGHARQPLEFSLVLLQIRPTCVGYVTGFEVDGDAVEAQSSSVVQLVDGQDYRRLSA